MSPLEIFVLRVFVFSEIEMVMINWYQTFLSSNSVCNYTSDYWLQTELDGPLLETDRFLLTQCNYVSLWITFDTRFIRWNGSHRFSFWFFFFNFQTKDLRRCSREQLSLSVHYSYTWAPLLVERSTRVEIKYEEVKIA